MKLIPRLMKSKMFLCFGERVEVERGKFLQSELGRKPLDVEEWDRTGLCIHEYYDEYGMRNAWRISHIQSGRSILKHMRSREQAIEYLAKVRTVHKDWTFEEKEFQALPNRSSIVEKLRVLQKSISGVRR
jgi:hypothetical protein